MKATARLLLSLSLSAVCFLEVQALSLNYAEKDNTSVYISKRPDNRLFVSRAVDEEIERICTMLKNKKLAWVFSNCLPNTLDTTIHYKETDDGDDTFVYTGDIHARRQTEKNAARGYTPPVQMYTSRPLCQRIQRWAYGQLLVERPDSNET